MTLIDRDNNGRDDRDDLHDLAARALEDRGFRTRFPAEVTRALDHVTPLEEGALRDLTHLPWSSIDNESSRDLDQVEWAERGDGFIRVMVGIAEVADFAPADGPVDRAALHNTATVYTAGGIFPMLPTALSEGGDTARGTWVRLFRPAVEGKLVAKAEGLDVGEHLTVRLEAADVVRAHLDFARV